MGTLVVKEDRSIVNKFRDWYRGKVVDSGRASKFEKLMDVKYDLYKKKNDIIGKVLPTILTFIPDANFLAPIVPTLAKIGNKYYDLEKSVLLGSKRYLEANFIGVDGSNKEVILPRVNIEELGKDVLATSKQIENAVSENDVEIESVGRSR